MNYLFSVMQTILSRLTATFPYRTTGKIWHKVSPSVHSFIAYRMACSGMLMEQNSRSEMHREMMKAVVA